jgi:GT2 family glycosyltransferase
VSIGVVVIGRNEGERLGKCLASLRDLAGRVVYVDSGSTDGSVELARGLGADVVALDMRIPFTAARARNEGFRRLRESAPDLAYVQFVDGDCEVAGGWLREGAGFLDGHERAAAVCGRLREKFPAQSIYNMLCDIEWDHPAGESKACGGIAMMRAGAFENAGGFRADLIAGEEPELCVRLRAARWQIWRLADEMALHDAAILHFGQWWRRALRGGYAFAQGRYLHGAPPERYGVRESISAWFWGFAVPAGILGAALAWGWQWLALSAVYPIQVCRIALRGRRSARENWWRAAFLVLGKFPEMLGQAKFQSQRFSGRQARLIEYK